MTYSEIISRVPLAKREVADAYLKGWAEGVGISFIPSPDKNVDARTSQTSERADLSETAWKELLK